MTLRTARWIAWSLVALYITLATHGLILQSLSDTSYTNIAFPVLLAIIPVIAIWPVIGALIISRHPRHPVGWLLCVGLLAVAFDMFFSGYVSYDINVYAGTLPGITFALLWLEWSGFPFATTAFTLMVLLFPDGRPLSPSWRKVAWAAAATLLLYLPIQAVSPGVVDPFTGILLANPLAASPSLWAILEPLWYLSLAMLGLCYLAALISLLLRLRRARGDERQQIKWLVIPAVVFLPASLSPFWQWSKSTPKFSGLPLSWLSPRPPRPRRRFQTGRRAFIAEHCPAGGHGRLRRPADGRPAAFAPGTGHRPGGRAVAPAPGSA
jgi:two-component system NarL family sensor kinase